MKKYTVLIVDDEEPARGLIQLHASKVSELEVVDTCANAIDAKRVLSQKRVDILFLDIHMDEISGLDLLRMLRHQPVTILTTAYSEFALEGYELDVIDYLMKPIAFDRFFKAASKAMKIVDAKQMFLSNKLPKSVASPVSKAQFMFIKVDNKMVKVSFDQLLYLESFGEYVKVYTHKGMQLTLRTLASFEDSLPKAQFSRIHRSYMVNLDKIEMIEDNTVRIEDNCLPVSRRLKDDFLKAIKARGIF